MKVDVDEQQRSLLRDLPQAVKYNLQPAMSVKSTLNQVYVDPKNGSEFDGNNKTIKFEISTGAFINPASIYLTGTLTSTDTASDENLSKVDQCISSAF